MLRRISQNRSVGRRRTMLGMIAVGVFICLVPTLRRVPARAEQERRQDAEQAKLAGRFIVNPAQQTNRKADDAPSASAPSQAQDSIPLVDAVAAFNEEAAEYLAPYLEQKNLSEDQLPEVLTLASEFPSGRHACGHLEGSLPARDLSPSVPSARELI